MPDSPTPADAAPKRRRLDRFAVLEAAEAYVDAHGYDALTMTVLAGELNTRVSSLYNHVANLDDLRSQIQVRAMHLLGQQVRTAAMGQAGAEGLRTLGAAFRAFAREYPQRYSALTRSPLDRPALREAAGDTIEALAVMTRSTGLPEDRIISTCVAIFAALHGFVSLESSGYFGDLPDLDDVYAQVVQGAVQGAVDTDR